MTSEQKDPRDLMEGTSQRPDYILINHIEEAIERLQEHMDVPTLGAYERFLRAELEWIEHEKRIRRVLTKPLP